MPYTTTEVLTAALRTEFTGLDGKLIKTQGGWSPETVRRADLTGKPGSPEWYAALGTHDHATLTADGRGVITDWCRGHNPPADTWVRYERWTAQGRVAHGFVCPDIRCRRITQSG